MQRAILFLDTGGFDARSKLQILLTHSFGITTKPEEVFNVGFRIWEI